MSSSLIASGLALAAAVGVSAPVLPDELVGSVWQVVSDVARPADSTAHAWAAAGAPVVGEGARLNPGDCRLGRWSQRAIETGGRVGCR